MAGAFRNLRRFWRPVDIPDECAHEFRAFQERAYARIALPAFIAATLVMTGLVGIDLIVIPDMFWPSMIVRLGIALPVGVIAGTFLAVRSRSLITYKAFFSSVAIIYGALACALVAGSQSHLAPVYMTANNITIIFTLLIIGLPPGSAAVTALIVMLFQGVAVYGSAFYSVDLLFLTSGISVTVAAVGLYGNVMMDRAQRERFIAQRRDTQRIKALASQNAFLEHLSALDFLTGVSNRRSFDAVLNSVLTEIETAAGGAVALAMIDIDHFKLFNDALGHPAGDEALKQVAKALESAANADHVVARYGGEEFALVMPRTSTASLDMIAARLRAAVEARRIPHPASPTARHLTVSIGVSHAPASVSARALIQSADEALYAAKQNGRNQFVIRPVTSKAQAASTTKAA